MSEPAEAAAPVGRDDTWSAARYWGLRVAAAILVVVAAASVLFAILALVFGAFVESGD